jgi:hypothetical protein
MTLPDYNITDPFTVIYEQIRTIIMGDRVLGPLLSAIKFKDLADVAFQQLISTPSTNYADTPQVYLVQGKRKISPFGWNSKIASWIQTYPLIATHFDQRLVDTKLGTNPFKWRLMTCLNTAGPQLGLNGLVYGFNDDDGVDDIFGHQEFKQFQDRWMTVDNIQVTAYVSRDTIAAGS